jgi:ABC-type dipeptide/oligopeptide/nickel transport system permease component
LATIVRLVRASMLDILRQDFITAARAGGVSDFKVTYKHALKNAITPIITVVGLGFGVLLAGAPGLETTFSWPGLGYQFVQAVGKYDLPLVQGLTIIIAVMVLVANIITDMAYAYLDPRVRLS